MKLDAAALNAIVLETRQCFLTEDAPLYLGNLQQGLAKLERGQPDYTALMHAAHSLKGGAGIAQLPSLSKLAHKLEDLLEILQKQEFVDRATVGQILSQGTEEMAMVLGQVMSLPSSSLADIPVDAELLQTLEVLLEMAREAAGDSSVRSSVEYDGGMPEFDDLMGESLPNLATNLHVDARVNSATSISPLIKSALEHDLEACLDRTEKLLQSQTHISVDAIAQSLGDLQEECILLGETLDLEWLIESGESFDRIIKQDRPLEEIGALGLQMIQAIRSQRSQFLHEPARSIGSLDLVKSGISDTPDLTKVPTNPSNGVDATNAKFAPAEVQVESITPVSPSTPELVSYLRIPSHRIERMTNTVGELIIRHERLLRQQQQLGQTNKNLRSLVSRLAPMQDRVQTLYDQLAISTTNNSHNHSQSLPSGLPKVGQESEFDALELDRYTTAHGSLQDLQEILLRIRETRADIDLSHRELGEEIEQLRQDLDLLYSDLTQSRLVPFKNLANRFIPQLNRLCQRYGKKVELVIQGEEVLIDQAILEQLQTPLNHLLLNAFDHGIEPADTRMAMGKPETARIILKATISGDRSTISIEDDGGGIDLTKVHQRAVEKGLCPHNLPMGQLRREEILNFIFQPGFSTTQKVSDISGRGMGLDIVRSQVNQLRGSMLVETQLGQGTTFIVRLPLGLSLLSMLICNLAGESIAIPSNSVLDILLYDEVEMLEPTNPTAALTTSRIRWRQQPISLLPLAKLLPYGDRALPATTPRVCLILSGMVGPLAITVDAILEERQLILKPFDRTVPVPSYISGCAILGTGKVVPVMMPNELGTLLDPTPAQRQGPKQPALPLQQINTKASRTILIAEDSIATRNMLERLLRQSGHTVIACRDGQEAIDAMNRAQGKVDLVLSDIEMPRMNGFSLLQTIRTHDSWYAVPVVMLTSRTGDRHRQKAIGLGASGYLSKPIVPMELISYINESIEKV